LGDPKKLAYMDLQDSANLPHYPVPRGTSATVAGQAERSGNPCLAREQATVGNRLVSFWDIVLAERGPVQYNATR
jgi:hypothetical protein